MAASMKVKISAIDMKGRIRKDLGDVATLAESIKELGLLQPIVITKDKKLVCGRRRIEACKKLGWEEVPAIVASSADSLLSFCRAENDENTCRKDFTPEEAVRSGQRIEAEVAKLAKAEMKKGKGADGSGGRGNRKNLGESCAKVWRDNSKRTVNQVASTVGMSGRQYEKAKVVVDSGDKQAIAQMNKTGKVDPAYRAVKREEKKQAIKKKAAEAAKAPAKQKWHIIHGDCIEQLPKVGRPRLIVADPPYNIGINYSDDFCDDIAEAEYVAWTRAWVNACANAITDDGSIFVIINDENAEDMAAALNDAGLYRRAWIKWYETFGVNCTNNFNRCSRHILYYVADPKKFVFNAESRHIRRPSDRQTKYGDGRADPNGKLWDDVWQIPRLVDNADERMPGFPTQIPLAITRAIVSCASEPGDLVVDPFCGSGSTGHAALELHRRFVGIEFIEQWHELATLRLVAVQPCDIEDL